MTSMRVRLFAILLLATGVVWASAVIWIHNSTRAKVERVLDARLAESARMVSSLLSDQKIEVVTAVRAVAAQTAEFPEEGGTYVHQLSCQIWGLDGRRVAGSGNAPDLPLTGTRTGFSISEVGGVSWRVFSVVNEERGVRVMVGDSIAIRDRLVRDVTTGLILPAALILPALALLIWVSLGKGMAPLAHMADALRLRSATDLGPITQLSPREIEPIRDALNSLFDRVSQARDREQAFTAYAAHELKTPLAGLKLQAQIAVAAPEASIRDRALAQILAGVDRTDRLARQLLDMAAVDAETLPTHLPPTRLSAIIDDTIADTAALWRGREIRIEVDVSTDTVVSGAHRFLLFSAIRNLLENAVNASPKGEVVTIHADMRVSEAVLAVSDRGPGIPAADRATVVERFFRSGPGSGSGLGLSIVSCAIQRIGGSLILSERPGGGEVVLLLWPECVT
ncbi:ATP-binding protein [Frigidibacter sp. MR17.14]|uniref:ATP-binding protein n=1 Tax=Frigidibacter sp. MR17.14 TaxID=3126509 RepID=UPI003012DC87